jgi:hypothetical protein
MNTMTLTPENTVTVPAFPSQITDLVDDLTGFHPALDRAVQALEDLAAADLDADRSQSVVAALGGLCDGSVSTLLGLVLRHIADPDTNPALADLPAKRKQALRRLGAEYAAGADDWHQQALASEASAVIDGV